MSGYEPSGATDHRRADGWMRLRGPSTEPAGPLPAALTSLGAAAGAALERYAAGLVSEDEALDAVARIARAAGRAGVGPERVVAAVKAGWYALPAVRAGEVSLAESRARLGRVVEACVEGYFTE